jgi:hypothetical protein
MRGRGQALVIWTVDGTLARRFRAAGSEKRGVRHVTKSFKADATHEHSPPPHRRRTAEHRRRSLVLEALGRVAAGDPVPRHGGVARGAVRISSVVAVGQAGDADLRRTGHLVRRHRAVRRPAAHARRRRPWRHHAAGGAQARLPRPAGPARGAVRRAAAPELPAPAADVQPVRGPQHAAAAGAAGQAAAAAGQAATASRRARRSASACSWRRKTWRSCWAPRASASTRSSRASSARARCAWSRRGWSCCRATS